MAVIEVFADVCCPFTHVGLRRLVEHRARVGHDDVRLRVRAWPLELVNGRPLDPGFVAEEVAELREQVAPDMFEDFRVESFPTSSIPALALAARAYESCDDLGERVSLALRDALFEHGADIGDPAVVAELAARFDVPASPAAPDDEALVYADWELGRGRGVVGSPHFFLRDSDYFCPSLRVERVDGHLRISADDEAFARFAMHALGS